MKNIISESLVKEVQVLIEQGSKPSVVKRFISKITGYKKTKSNQVFNDIVSGNIEVAPDLDWSNTLEGKDSPYYNGDTQQYIVFIKNLGRNVVVSKEQHESILRMYSNWDGEERSISEICRVIQWPRAALTEYLSKFGIKHDSLPLVDEDILEKSEEELVQQLLESKKFSVHQKFEKALWDKTREEATKFNLLKHRSFDPFEEFLRNWTPPTLIKPDKLKLWEDKSDEVFVIGLSDLHYGAASKERYMYNAKSWGTEDTVKAVDKFASSIISSVENRKRGFKKAILLCLGDLIHSMYGKTARGTELTYDCIREEQFDYAMSSLTSFISRMLNVFDDIEVHATFGNHHYEVEMALFKALEAYFRTDERIKFNLYSSRPAAFKVDSTLFLIDHGADARERTYVPNGAKRQSFIQSLLLSKPELLTGVKTKLFCQGDKHHWENIEFNDFEFIMFSTILGSDEHAQVNNWKNRARQSCLVLNDDGLKEIVHTYIN